MKFKKKKRKDYEIVLSISKLKYDLYPRNYYHMRTSVKTFFNRNKFLDLQMQN